MIMTVYIGVSATGSAGSMWPRRSAGVADAAARASVEKQPLLAVDPECMGETLICGVGKKIGVKAENMGYVVVDPPVRKPKVPSRGASALQQWGAVAVGLLESTLGHKNAKPTRTPSSTDAVRECV